MNTFQVPVWFNITAVDQEDAWQKINKLMYDLERDDQLPDYVVEEPVEISEND